MPAARDVRGESDGESPNWKSTTKIDPFPLESKKQQEEQQHTQTTNTRQPPQQKVAEIKKYYLLSHS